MAKDTFYFSHDYNARSDIKIKKLIAKQGMQGYGIYWAIVEELYNNANALPTDYETIAFDLRSECEQVKMIVENYGLFEIVEGNFSSNSIERRLKERAEKSDKARESAKARWNKNANAMRTHSDSNAIKERKGKEIKEKESREYTEIFDDYKKHLLSRTTLDRLSMNAPVSISQQHSEMVMNEFLQTCYGDLVEKKTKLQAEQYFINWVKKDNRVNEAINNQIRKRNARNKQNTTTSN